MVGSMIRLFSFYTNDFWPIFIGTSLVAFARPIFLGSPSLIANRWFADNERAMALTIQNVNQALGSTLAFILAGYYFKDEGRDSL